MNQFGRIGARAVVLAALSCGGGGALPSGTGGAGSTGTAGTSGAAGTGGGVAGTSGAAGTGGGVAGSGSGGTLVGRGGTGGMALPTCTTGNAIITEGVVLDPSDTIITSAALTAAVTVTAVDSCATVTCQCQGAACSYWKARTGATRAVVSEAGDGRQWTLLLAIPGMQWDRIKVGDAFDLSLSISAFFFNREIVLSRAGKLFLFTSNIAVWFSPSFPDLTAFGITFVDAGGVCSDGSAICPTDQHTARVVRGTESATVTTGQTVTLGDLSLSTAQLTGGNSQGNCDVPAIADLAGFTSP